MGRGLASLFSREADELGAEEAENQNSFLERVENRHGITLVKTGLELQPVKGPGTIYHGADTIDSSALKFNLADAAQFITYLQALDAESISPSQIQGLIHVANVLESQLLQEYEGSQKDPRTVQLMSGLESLVENYHRLDPQGNKGLITAVQELPTIERAYRGDYLPQYLEIHRQGLFSKVGEQKFGPSEWHEDMGDDSYRERWTKALKVLEELKKNPRAMELHSELLSNLLACAEHAYQKLQKEAKAAPLKNPEKRKTLEEVLGRLSEGVN